MNFWEFLDKMIREPPWVLVLVLIAILVSHALKIVLEFVRKRRQPNALIISLETIVVIVLSYLALHLYLARHAGGGESTKLGNEPLLMTCLLVFFTLLSMLVYLFFKAAVQDQDSE